MGFSFEIIAGLTVLLLLALLVAGVALAVTLGRAKMKVWSAAASLRRGELAAAVAGYREAASLTVGTADFFKLWGGQRDSFDQALAGLATAYQQAGVAVDLGPLAELHQRTVRASKREGAGLVAGSGEELARWREQGRQLLKRLPQLPAGTRPRPGQTLPGQAPAAFTATQPAAAAPFPPAPTDSISQQLAPPHWRCPRWFEIRLQNDLLPRIGFCALIALAAAAAVATPLMFVVADQSFYYIAIPLASLLFAAIGFFAAAQRIAPGTTEVECRPMSLVRKTSQSVVGFNVNTTYWSDTEWPYSNIQVCGIMPPGPRHPFGLLVVCAGGKYSVLGIPADFSLPTLAQFLAARGVKVQAIAEIRPAWLSTWQSPLKWIASGAAAGVAILALLLAFVVAPGAAAMKPKDVAQQGLNVPPVPNPGPMPAPPQIPSPPPALPTPPAQIPGPPQALPATSSPPINTPPAPMVPPVTPPVAPVTQPAPAPVVAKLELRHTWNVPELALRGYAISPDGNRGAFFNYGSYLAVAASPTDEPRPVAKAPSSVNVAAFSSDGNRLYAMHGQGLAAIDPTRQVVQGNLKVDSGIELAVSKSGDWLATVAPGKVTIIERAKSKQPRQVDIASLIFTLSSLRRTTTPS